MPYVTVMSTPVFRQVTLEEILEGYVDLSRFAPVRNSDTGTITRFRKTLPYDFVSRVDITGMVRTLDAFNQKYANLLKEERTNLYRHFEIDKASIDPVTGRHKKRPIDAPCPELKLALTELKMIMEEKCGALYHTSAFAYIRGRCAVDSIRKHQGNCSHWFLKTDFSNFFGNTTPAFMHRMLQMVFPFSEMYKSDMGRKALETALSLCFLNGGLPQGSPISPLLTNLMMIPIDHRLSNTLQNHIDHNHYVYTRYADDILISCKVDFKYKEIVSYINQVLAEFHAPFTINPGKTRYGSGNGHNFNLGVILNEKNEITIGYKKKREFRSMLHDFVMATRNGEAWQLNDIQILNGLYAYYTSIEPKYWEDVITRFNQKFNIDTIAMMRSAM